MKVGDLVYVKKAMPCCATERYLGKIYQIRPKPPSFEGIDEIVCISCKAIVVGKWIDVGNGGFPIEVLRVIPPLNELEAEKAVETV